MNTDTAYTELGLAPGASEAQVKAAWRRLVSQWHPDRNDSAHAVRTMQRINRAFQALRQAGFVDPEPEATPAPTPDARPAEPAPHPDRARRTLSRRIKLSLEEAARGCTKTLRGKLGGVCEACDGARYRVLGGACPACDGSGAVRQRTWFGWLATSAECESCQGGGIAREPCGACDGSGKQPERPWRVSVRIPPGVREGDMLFVDGRRQRVEPAPVDLDLRIELTEHAFFQLDEDGTVRCEIPVNGFEWIGQQSIAVPTLDGIVRLPLSRDRTSYRLPHKGFPIERSGRRADAIVTIVPLFPDTLSTDQQILLDQLIATALPPEQPSGARLATWQRRMRDWSRQQPTAPTDASR